MIRIGAKSDGVPADARQRFARVMGQWVQDLMRLRRTGQDVPCYRTFDPLGDGGVMPPERGGVGHREGRSRGGASRLDSGGRGR